MQTTAIRRTRRKTAGAGDELRIHAFPSELGWMAAVRRVDQLCRFTFGHPTPGDALASLGACEEVDVAADLDVFALRMQRFAAGQEDDFLDVPLAFERFTSFQRRVLERCRHIRAGQTLTYTELAREVGRAGAARAVGNVMAANPFPLIVPCHRVVGAEGRLGGYSGPSGLVMKRRLLEREGIPIPGRRE